MATSDPNPTRAAGHQVHLARDLGLPVAGDRGAHRDAGIGRWAHEAAHDRRDWRARGRSPDSDLTRRRGIPRLVLPRRRRPARRLRSGRSQPLGGSSHAAAGPAQLRLLDVSE